MRSRAIAPADTLLRVAEKDLYRPLWSQRILGEAQAAIEEILRLIAIPSVGNRD